MIKMEGMGSTNSYEVGASVNASSLTYASLLKYTKGDETNIKLKAIKFFYERDECLIAIKLIFIDYSKDSADREILTEPKVFGPIETYSTPNVIDEITLNLERDEQIYLVKGTFMGGRGKNKFLKMGLYTTYGQFVEFGRESLEYNFTWEYYFNLVNFDGFIIGWDDNHVTYLASLLKEKGAAATDDKNEVLADSTYDSRSFDIDLVYLSPFYGKQDVSTVIEDDLRRLEIFDKAKNGKMYLSEVVVYYDKFIHMMEVTYTDRLTHEKIKSTHYGSDSNIFI